MQLIRRAVVASLALGGITACASSDQAARTSTPAVQSHLWDLSTKSEDARKWTEAGEVAFDIGLFDDALRDFKRAVAADSAFAYGYLRIAQNAYSVEEYKANLQRANAFKSAANPAERLLIEAESRAFAGDVSAGMDSIRKVEALLPKNARVPYLLGYVQFLNGGEIDSVRAAFKRAVDLAPDWGAAQLNYGTAFIVEPIDLAIAEKHQEIGQKLWPDQPLTYDYLGDLRRKQSRIAEAAAAYSKQIELSPKEGPAHDQRGHAYSFLGKYDSARADYDEAIRLGRGNSPVFEAMYRAFVDSYEGHPEISIKRLEELSQAIDGMGVPEPDGMKLNVLQAIMTIAPHTGDFAAATKALEETRAVTAKMVERVNTPEFRRQQEANIAFWDGRTAALKGDFAHALQKAEEYRKLREPDRNPTKDRQYHIIRGFVALGQKRYADAITELRQGDPDEPFQNFKLAQALEADGKAAEAKALYKSVANYNFNSPGFAAVRRDALAKAAN